MERFSWDLSFTFFPGSSFVPFADLTMALVFSPSITMRLWLLANCVEVLCRGLIHQAHILIIRRELDSSNIPFYFVGA
jgi:hypothetical protein